MIGINFYVLCCLGRCEVTLLHMVGTIERKDRCDIFCGKLAFKRMSLVLEAYYWTGINYQSFVLSKQFALTSLFYMQLVSILILQL